MLEDARPGEVAALGDVADQEDRDARALGDLEERGRTLADLRVGGWVGGGYSGLISIRSLERWVENQHLMSVR